MKWELIVQKSEFLASLEELFESDEGSLTGSEVITEIPGWCSLIFVGLIALVDEQYQVAIAPESLLNGQTVDGLFAQIKKLVSERDRAAA